MQVLWSYLTCTSFRQKDRKRAAESSQFFFSVLRAEVLNNYRHNRKMEARCSPMQDRAFSTRNCNYRQRHLWRRKSTLVTVRAAHLPGSLQQQAPSFMLLLFEWQMTYFFNVFILYFLTNMNPSVLIGMAKEVMSFYITRTHKFFFLSVMRIILCPNYDIRVVF